MLISVVGPGAVSFANVMNASGIQCAEHSLEMRRDIIGAAGGRFFRITQKSIPHDALAKVLHTWLTLVIHAGSCSPTIMARWSTRLAYASHKSNALSVRLNRSIFSISNPCAAQASLKRCSRLPLATAIRRFLRRVQRISADRTRTAEIHLLFGPHRLNYAALVGFRLAIEARFFKLLADRNDGRVAKRRAFNFAICPFAFLRQVRFSLRGERANLLLNVGPPCRHLSNVILTISGRYFPNILGQLLVFDLFQRALVFGIGIDQVAIAIAIR